MEIDIDNLQFGEISPRAGHVGEVEGDRFHGVLLGVPITAILLTPGPPITGLDREFPIGLAFELLSYGPRRQAVINVFLQEEKQDQRGDNRNDHTGRNHLPMGLVRPDESEQRSGDVSSK
ncbi:MAG TPA: hypothetical protein VLE49_16575 [Anaerolineales bacterium]|nr:hypothetical protein [Anaerolineales bacterium]